MKKIFALFIIFILNSIPIRAEVEVFYLGNIQDIKDKEIDLIGFSSRLEGKNKEAFELLYQEGDSEHPLDAEVKSPAFANVTAPLVF